MSPIDAKIVRCCQKTTVVGSQEQLEKLRVKNEELYQSVRDNDEARIQYGKHKKPSHVREGGQNFLSNVTRSGSLEPKFLGPFKGAKA